MMSGIFGHSWALWILVIAWGFVALEASLRGRWSWFVLLRFLWTGLLSFLIADYVLIRDQKFSERSMVNVFVDASDSVQGLGERQSRTQQFLKELQEWSSNEHQPLKIFSFARTAHEISNNENLKTDGSESLLQPAYDLVATNEGTTILLSDGLWTDFPKPSMRTFAIQVGDDDEKDVWIDSVQNVTTAFLKNRLKLPIVLGQKGYSGKSVQVSLWKGSEKIDEQKARLEAGSTNVNLTYFPEKMGESVLIVKIEPFRDELSSLNNQTAIRVRTVRDKIRILHIGGKPSYDLKTLRLFLTRQPDVDLVSFYILRATQDDPEARNNELSLIPFPYEDLFSTELSKVDLVILHNFDFNLYFQPFYLSNLAQFVRQGGALWMIGGDQSFHRYRGSPLESLFPFQFQTMGDLEKNNEHATVSEQHPILKGSEIALKSINWSGRHQVASVPQAQDLVKYQSGIPMISIREADKGRVVALNTDEFYRLQMEPTSDSAAYGRLARHLLQYLTFDPEMDPGRLISTKWSVGKTVNLSLANGNPGVWKIKSLHDSSFSKEFKGQSSIEFEVPNAGWYQVENSNLTEPTIFETEEKPWRFEWKRLISDDRPLIKLAQQSEGKFYSFADRKNIFDIRLSGRELISSETMPWARGTSVYSWVFLVISLISLFLDFYFRKLRQWDL